MVPRVLFICATPLHTASNTGLTFGSLFDGWPVDRLRQVYSDEDRPDGQDDAGNWNLTLRSVHGFRTVFSASFRARVRERTAPLGVPSAIGTATTNSAQKAIGLARAWAEFLPFELSDGFWRWLEKDPPDVLFSPLGSLRFVSAVDTIAKRLRTLVIPFFCDDWPIALYRFGPLVLPPRLALRRRIASLMTRTPVLLCGSDAMAREYEHRYGIEALGFMRCVSVPASFTRARDPEGPLKLLYVGGLHLGRWQVIEALGDALRRLEAAGEQATLSVYAPGRDVAALRERLERHGLVRVVGSIRPEDVPAILTQANVLVHVESFDEAIVRFTRLSLSTKLPEYMAAGRAILAIGPASLASIQYVRDTGAGLVVPDAAPAAISDAIRRLARDPVLTTALGRAGWEAARRRHDGESERARFRALLSHVVSQQHADH